MPDPLDFYRRLPVRGDFAAVANAETYAPAPAGWSVLVADVADSTGAIRAGRYKDVNVLGASVLAGVFNAFDSIDLPFVFGGDGATLVLPAALVPLALPAFDSARRTGLDVFGLELRVGVVPLAELYADGHTLGVARVALTNNVALAAFSGDALAEAERRVKADPAKYAVAPHPGAADLSGLECRWNGIPSPGGVMLSVLVTPAPGANTHAVINGVLKKLRASHPEAGPVESSRLSITTDPEKLSSEHRLKHAGIPRFLRPVAMVMLRLHTAIGRFLIERRVRIRPLVDLSGYKRDVVLNSDHRKYDGTLRLVLATDPARRAELESWLESRHLAGELAYGTHADPEALMTCLVFNRHDRHLHFIDVNNGGYASASVGLKQRLASLKTADSGTPMNRPTGDLNDDLS
jgi:hypothetical protein